MEYDSANGNLRLALTGDSMITRPMSRFTEQPFLGLVDLLRGADAAVTNLEMLFHNYESAPAYMPGGSYMRAAPELLDELLWMGINMFAAPNNHSFDFGENGLVQHLSVLDESAAVYAGIGRTMGEAREARYLDTPAGRVALVAVTSTGPAQMYAGHQWRDVRGRPGASMLRYTSRYTVDDEVFRALRRLRDEMRLSDRVRRGPSGSNRNQSLGISDIPDTDDEFYLGDLHCGFQYPTPDGYRFVRGDDFSVELVPNAWDLDEILERVSEARRQADWVVVSMHNHEQGASPDDPSALATTLARAAIDRGADVFHGHGPHRDRGIEIYRGKPIFYSIGHFIVQHDTISRIPFDNMMRQGHGWTATAADFFDMRSGREQVDEWLGHAANPAAWRDVVAVVEFQDHALHRVELHPITLGFRQPRAQRGRPMLASGAEAEAVLAHFAELSEPHGSTVDIEDGIGVVRSGEQTGNQDARQPVTEAGDADALP